MAFWDQGPYKPCNNNLYSGIIIFPHTDNTQSKRHNQFKEKKGIKKTEKGEGPHEVDSVVRK